MSGGLRWLGGRRRRPGWTRRVLVAGAACAASLPLIAAAAPPPYVFKGTIWSPYSLAGEKSVPGIPLASGAGTAARARIAAELAGREPGTSPVTPGSSRPAWPAVGSTIAVLPSPGTRVAPYGPPSLRALERADLPSSFTRAGTLPVQLAATGASTGSVQVSMASQAQATRAGVRGVVVGLSAAGGAIAGGGGVRVRLAYSSFAGEYGGGWSSRLRLVELPACALTTPDIPACRVQTPVAGSVNDAAGQALSATVALPATPSRPVPLIPGASSKAAALATDATTAAGAQVVLAAAATPAGAAGDFTATTLKPSGNWAVQQGDFTYQYPITVPDTLGGTAPSVSLSYDAQSIDSETSNTNTQGGWIGDGWDYSPGFIERSYQSCQQDGISNSGDECWDGNNAVLSLAGQTSVLVKDDTTGTWHLQGDDGSSAQLETGAANGLWSGEYWVVTTTDGTKYYFGLGHLPGTSTGTASSSAWGMPVYTPKSGDPCYSQGTGNSSMCANMGWRWNLDYVVTPDNQLTAYNYAAETNYYQAGNGESNTGAGTMTQYDRGGYLTSISYGWLLSDATAGKSPAAQVSFTSSYRCTSATTSTCTGNENATYWPDVPWDLSCTSASTTSNCTNYSPTFWTQYRLTGITTRVLTSGTTYQNADSYTLAQTFPSGAASNPVIYLGSIARTGDDGGTSAALTTSFGTPVEIDNRVDGLTPAAGPVDRPRIEQITTPTDSQINVLYATPACSRLNGTMPSSADSNTMPCFPVYWTPTGEGQIQDWFTKSLVSQVTVNDATGAGAPAQVTSYTYLGGAAWHQNESPVVRSSQRTWDQFRGYAQVEVTTGASPDPVTEAVTTYMRGMNGDPTSSGGTASFTVKDTVGDTYNDDDWLAGQVLETDTYTSAASGATVDSKSVDGPWTYTQTAYQSDPASDTVPSSPSTSANPDGSVPLSAHLLRQSEVRTLNLLASGSWGTRAITTYDDSDARVTAIDDKPDGSPETCTSTSYATPSGNAMMLTYPDQVTSVTGAYASGACPAATSSNLVTDTKDYYDGTGTSLPAMGTWGTVTSGLLSGVAKAKTWPSGGAEGWVSQSATSYDVYGRTLTSTDARGLTTKTTFTPATGTLPTSIAVLNPMGWTTTTTLDQARQLPTKVTDPNSEITTESYDPLGRLTAVILPIDQASGDDSYKYSYTITGTSPPAITTGTVREDGTYAYSVDIYDGMLQLRQQQQTPLDNEAGRLVTDTFHDSHGWVVKTSQPFYDSSTGPGASIDTNDTDAVVPSQTVTTYDGQGRAIESALFSLGHFQWASYTAYPGMNQTDVTPPAGGVATTSVTNMLGQQTQGWQYATTATPDDKAADAAVTTYAYTPAGQVASVTDNAGNATTSSYDFLGELQTEISPSTGTASYSYDPDGNVSTETTPRGTIAFAAYDNLNRPTAEYSGSTTGTELAAWAYDSLEKGQPTSSTSYDSSGQAYVDQVTGYTAAYESKGESETIPSDAGTGLAGTYSTASTYTPITGLLNSIAYGADGGLPSETVDYSYDLGGLPIAFGGNSAFLDTTAYLPQGQVSRTTFGPSGKQLVRTYGYDAGTSRLLTETTNLQTLSSAADTVNYTYDQSGNITSASDAQNTGGTQLQCYTYDNLDRLAGAWTDTKGTSTAASPSVSGIGGCQTATEPTTSAATIGGPAPYWESFSYDILGDRTGETIYNTAGTAANNVTQTISYPGGNGTSAASLPDAASTIKTAVGATPATSTNYVTTTPSYGDGAGDTSKVVNTTTGTIPSFVVKPPTATTISYTPPGEVSSMTTGGGQTASYLYDAAGGLLLQKDPSATILYLFGGAEQLTLASGSTTATGLRLYAAPDGVTVARASSGTDPVSYLVGDQQGTSNEAVDATTLAQSRRYFDPYGNAVGTVPASWPDNRGFVGQPADTVTRFDLLGARQYDPVTGSFLSADSVFNPGSQSAGGYTYAASNPVGLSDPSGLVPQPPPDCCTTDPPTTSGNSGSNPGNPGTTSNPGGGNPGGNGSGSGACNSVSARFASNGPCQVLAPRRSAVGGWVDALAGVGDWFVQLGDTAWCVQDPGDCMAAQVEGNSLSDKYTAWIASMGLPTGYDSAYSSADIGISIVSIAIGGGAGAIVKGTEAAVDTTDAAAAAARAAESSTTPEAQQIIQSTARAQAARGADALKASLTPAERAAMDADPGLTRRMLGQAVHRLTAAVLDEAYPGRFLYRTRGPDFIDTTTGEMLELTTPGQVGAHLGRPGYDGVTMCTYILPAC